jgi:hypothetical protein
MTRLLTLCLLLASLSWGPGGVAAAGDSISALEPGALACTGGGGDGTGDFDREQPGLLPASPCLPPRVAFSSVWPGPSPLAAPGRPLSVYPIRAPPHHVTRH